MLRTRLVEHRVKLFALLPVTAYRFEETWTPRRQIVFRNVGGDLADMAGRWELEPVEEGTIVRYAVRLDPGFPVPGWMVRRSLHDKLPRLLDALRDRVEEGPSP